MSFSVILLGSRLCPRMFCILETVCNNHQRTNHNQLRFRVIVHRPAAVVITVVAVEMEVPTVVVVITVMVVITELMEVVALVEVAY